MPIKIAVIGTGRVAKGNYLPYLVKQPDLQLSCYSRTLEKARAVADQFKIKAVASPEELMADGPDALLVLTNELQRLEATEAFLRFRPRRLFFEKPLTARAGQAKVCEEDFFEGRELLRKAGQAGSQTAMVFNYRFFERTQAAQAAVRDRKFGRLLQVTGLANYACWSHCLDLILSFAGPLAEVRALEGPADPGDASRPRDVAAAFTFLNGAVGTVLGTNGLNFKHQLYELTFNYEGGRIHLRDLDGPLEILDYAAKRQEVQAGFSDLGRWDYYRASFEKSLGAYLDSIRRNEPPPVPGLAGLAELQFEAALKRSARERRPVDLQQEFPLESQG